MTNTNKFSNSHRICVFCGSSDGANPGYMQQAISLGRELAANGMGLVYGGASIGLMGAVADAALEGGAEVIGVIPEALAAHEIAHKRLSELHVVGSMHERKARMASLADAFIALPGGYGTLDEFLEILTWAQLGIHHKPCILVNTAGYYNGLLHFLDHAVAEDFLRNQNRELILLAEDASHALALIQKSPGPRAIPDGIRPLPLP